MIRDRPALVRPRKLLYSRRQHHTLHAPPLRPATNDACARRRAWCAVGNSRVARMLAAASPEVRPPDRGSVLGRPCARRRWRDASRPHPCRRACRRVRRVDSRSPATHATTPPPPRPRPRPRRSTRPLGVPCASVTPSPPTPSARSSRFAAPSSACTTTLPPSPPPPPPRAPPDRRARARSPRGPTLRFRARPRPELVRRGGARPRRDPGRALPPTPPPPAGAPRVPMQRRLAHPRRARRRSRGLVAISSRRRSRRRRRRRRPRARPPRRTDPRRRNPPTRRRRQSASRRTTTGARASMRTKRGAQRCRTPSLRVPRRRRGRVPRTGRRRRLRGSRASSRGAIDATIVARLARNVRRRGV